MLLVHHLKTCVISLLPIMNTPSPPVDGNSIISDTKYDANTKEGEGKTEISDVPKLDEAIDKTTFTVYKKEILKFLDQNYLLVGMFVMILVAYAYPSLGEGDGPLKTRYSGERYMCVCVCICGWVYVGGHVRDDPSGLCLPCSRGGGWIYIYVCVCLPCSRGGGWALEDKTLGYVYVCVYVCMYVGEGTRASWRVSICDLFFIDCSIYIHPSLCIHSSMCIHSSICILSK